ncbi:MAG: DUF805 domain-containing protein [Balneolales bacterium]|nr:DUF805 domain-containing protein [Balneolales bacterium]
MKWYILALKRFAEFRGRSRRREYWFYFLFNMIIFFVINMVESVSGYTEFGEFGPATVWYVLVMFTPSIAVTVRRLHDTNRSGFWLLISFAPVLGFLAMLYFTLSEGTAGANSYGPDPKQDQIITREAKEPEDFWKREDF